MIEIEALSALNDNYIWLIKNSNTHQCAVIDPGDANPVLEWLNKHINWQLVDILITHHHEDHIGGVNVLKSHTNAIISAPDNPFINKDRILKNKQLINVVGITTQVIATPGHTLDHITYYCPRNVIQNHNWLFSGDTLFSGGCGRIFEGTTEQMYKSLQILSHLPEDTMIFAAHEYTVNNLLFASKVEPNNKILQKWLTHNIKLRKQRKVTLPSLLNTEKQINPFLRCHLPPIISAAEKHTGHLLTSDIAVFNIIREWKNNF